jgi:hypothetical protein
MATNPTRNECAQGPPIMAAIVRDKIDQLENEVIHFMNMSMQEMEKSEALSRRLELVTKEKEHLEHQIDELDKDLSQHGWPGKDDVSTAIEAGDTIPRLKARITNLRLSALTLDFDFQDLTNDSGQDAKNIEDLQAQLQKRRAHLAQKTQEEDRLRKELQSMRETLSFEKRKNVNLLSRIKTTEHAYNSLNAWKKTIEEKLAESEKIRETLSGLLTQKATEVDNTQKAGAAQAEAMRRELDDRQKEIERLLATHQEGLVAKRNQSKSASQQQPVLRLRSAPANIFGDLRIPESDAARREIERQNNLIQGLTNQLWQSQQRRLRAVAIGIDFSGSAAGSLEVGIKRLYLRLLHKLQTSLCKTRVMTVIHGPGDTATTASNFGDSWEAHKKVLEGRKADGMEQHFECLRMIKASAVSHGLAFDLQVVLLGDSQFDQSSHAGAAEVCADFKSRSPPAPIHSVTVKTGSTRGARDKSLCDLKVWTPWKYASNTGGNKIVWSQNDPIPDLSDLVY